MSKVMFIYFGMFVKVFTQGIQMTNVQTFRSWSSKIITKIHLLSKVNVIYFGMILKVFTRGIWMRWVTTLSPVAQKLSPSLMPITLTLKPVLRCHSKRTQKLVFKTDYLLMQVKSIAEWAKGSILQYSGTKLAHNLGRSDFSLQEN